MEAAELELLFPFQSTPLMRGETLLTMIINRYYNISIHSPHARGDLERLTTDAEKRHFNPLPSCEGRPKSFALTATVRVFQSTPLMRGETMYWGLWRQSKPISIHSPHARGDSINL